MHAMLPCSMAMMMGSFNFMMMVLPRNHMLQC